MCAGADNTALFVCLFWGLLGGDRGLNEQRTTLDDC
jgi:hypothetical protein